MVYVAQPQILSVQLPPDEDVKGVESLNGLRGHLNIVDESGEPYSTDDSCIVIPRSSRGVTRLEGLESSIDLEGEDGIKIRTEGQTIYIGYEDDSSGESSGSDDDDDDDCTDPSGGPGIKGNADGWHGYGGGGIRVDEGGGVPAEDGETGGGAGCCD